MKTKFSLAAMALALSTSVSISIASSARAAQQAPKGGLRAACIDRLAHGENRLHVKLSAKALRRLSQGLAKYRADVTPDDVALLVDYSRNSKTKRAFLIDYKACDIVAESYVIHGGVTYHPTIDREGDPNDDGMLDRCLRKDGSRHAMTRPGLYLTKGCHQTSEQNWTELSNGCAGITLEGLEGTNRDAEASGVVLHEHHAIPDDGSIKPVGQGCPAFPPGRLNEMMKHGLKSGKLVYVYAPQCGG